jgi:uncharacterized protein (DUF433 family)
MQQEQLLQRIVMNPGIFGGKPIIRGMRMRVADILEMLSAGMTHAEILEDFPFIEEDDIRASLLFASLKINHSTLHAA